MSTMADYERADKCIRLTLENYFKEPDWFDSIDYLDDRRKKRHIESGIESKSLQPKRCDKCKRVYQKSVRIEKNKPKITYLNRQVFDGVRLIRETCNECR
jgi:hypothetical protein